MKILYITFFYTPDLSAGSFRNTTLVKELAKQLSPEDSIEVITTMPNRYKTYQVPALAFEQEGNVSISRLSLPAHKSNMKGQIRAFIYFFYQVNKRVKVADYDVVYASSSKLFTAFLGAFLARKKKLPLYLDIRDIFRESILDVLGKRWFSGILSFLLRQIENYTFGYSQHINLVSKGFRSYFEPYQQATFSYFTNGIDSEFLASYPNKPLENQEIKTILYAGNLGEGQGLHLIVPQLAKALGGGYQFVLIGDGGAKERLQKALLEEQVTNVQVRSPIPRKDLITEYQRADFLFLHLNTHQAFERVLPSKIFEYACFNVPIIAGVGGYASEFIEQYVSNCIIFPAGDCQAFLDKFSVYTYKREERKGFKQQFQRERINQEMARSILSCGKLLS